MRKDKDTLILENLYENVSIENIYSLINEELEQLKVVELSELIDHANGYCAHQPKIKEFAFGDDTGDNLFVVFAFVIFTMQKNWPSVKRYFPSFMDSFYQNFAGRNEDLDEFFKLSKVSEDEDIRKAMSMVSYTYKYLPAFYSNRKRNLDVMRELENDQLSLFVWIMKNVPGLSLAKGGFFMQLVTGKSGCFDSININIFGSKLHKIISDGKIKVPNKNGSEESLKKNINKYNDAMIELLGDNATQILWDMWCSIVEHRIDVYGTDEPLKFSYKGDRLEDIKPYRTKAIPNVPKDELYASRDSERYSSKDGITISGEHPSTIIGATRSRDKYKK